MTVWFGSLTLPTFGLAFVVIAVIFFFNRFAEKKNEKSKENPESEWKPAERQPKFDAQAEIDRHLAKEEEKARICESQGDKTCCKSLSENANDTRCNEKPTKVPKTKTKILKTEPITRLSVIYGTTTGNSKVFADILAKEVKELDVNVDVINIKDFDHEENLPNLAKTPNTAVVFIISTYTEGTPPEDAKWFCQWLEDNAKDFRVQHSILDGLRFSVFGLGNSLYSDYYNTVGKNVDKFLFQLSASRFHPMALGDENVAGSKFGSLENDFQQWRKKFIERIKKSNETEKGDQVKILPDFYSELSNIQPFYLE